MIPHVRKWKQRFYFGRLADQIREHGYELYEQENKQVVADRHCKRIYNSRKSAKQFIKQELNTLNK